MHQPNNPAEARKALRNVRCAQAPAALGGWLWGEASGVGGCRAPHSANKDWTERTACSTHSSLLRRRRTPGWHGCEDRVRGRGEISGRRETRNTRMWCSQKQCPEQVFAGVEEVPSDRCLQLSWSRPAEEFALCPAAKLSAYSAQCGRWQGCRFCGACPGRRHRANLFDRGCSGALGYTFTFTFVLNEGSCFE